MPSLTIEGPRTEVGPLVVMVWPPRPTKWINWATAENCKMPGGGACAGAVSGVAVATQTKTRQSASGPAVATGSETSWMSAASADDMKRGINLAETSGRAPFSLRHSAPLQDLKCLNDNVQPQNGTDLLLETWNSLLQTAQLVKINTNDGCIRTHSQVTARLF